MSRKTETRREVAPREYKATVEIACDLCGAKRSQMMESGGGMVARDDWGKERFDVNEITIEHKTGMSYPEGGDSITTAFDVCPACWDTKLLPWMKSQGAEPHVTSSDW